MKKSIVSGILIGAIILLVPVRSDAQKFTGLAPTPPMGWSSWNHFSCDVNEKVIREVADAIISSGMKDAGYIYINIDDCWHGTRDSLGFIQANPEHFPSGMKALADYLHARGLKLGIYSDAGWKTCAGRPGSRGHEYQDARMYASWNIDYLKYDWCYTDGLKAEGAYLTMRDALYEAGRPMIFSLCEWGNDQPWKWGATIGHLWRISGDIYPCFDCIDDHVTYSNWGVEYILDMHNNDTLRKYSGPDHWNDFDMMEIGNGMPVNEDRAHFSMWCMLASPLITGHDPRKMTPEVKAMITDREVISINQDSLGIQAMKYKKADSVEVWVKPLVNNQLAVCFLNRGRKAAGIDFDWTANIITDPVAGIGVNFAEKQFIIRDLWQKKELGTTKKPLQASIGGHDVLLLKLTPKK